MANSNPFDSPWTPDSGYPPPEAFHVERVIDPFIGKECIGMVRHAGRPYVVTQSNPDSKIAFDDAQRVALDYLELLPRLLEPKPDAGQWIHEHVWALLCKPRKPDECRFGWLCINWGDASHNTGLASRKGTMGSFWVNRVDSSGQPATPRLLVLLAGTAIEKHSLQAGSDVGLRIVMHVFPDSVRIYGVTMSGLSSDRAIKAVPQVLKQDARAFFEWVKLVRDVVGPALTRDLQGNRPVWIGSLETSRTPGAAPGLLSATGFALRDRGDSGGSNDDTALVKKPTPSSKASPAKAIMRARAYDFRVDLRVDAVTSKVQVVEVHRDSFVGSGATEYTTQRAFLQDGASQGPASKLRGRRTSSNDADLCGMQNEVDLDLNEIGALLFSELPPATRNKLRATLLSTSLFETRGASERSEELIGGKTALRTDRGVVRVSQPPNQSNAGPGGETVVRSDEQGSIETHVRAAELFERLRGYGIDARTYFRFARLPLVQRARPAMRWAPDGELPNAEVRPFMGDAEADRTRAPLQAYDRLQLLVKYGSADPMHRRKLPLAEGAPHRLKAQYLSVASDPRWAWHEFGHVLNFASTGELEFPFAHSAGDALAAIAADPQSQLARAEDPESSIRHVTFPWIEVPGRSHGRSAARGYGWCGCRNLTRLDFTSLLERYHHGYFGEQLMSSSLFRLYRSLGGDTRSGAGLSEADRLKEEDTRLSASDYCVYLIIRAISLLGPDSLAPARTPDQWVSALIDADLGTADWDVEAVWPFNRVPRTIKRHGGRVHKVIRWAFEQQGLYATESPLETVDSVGKAPAVDVYIADAGRLDGGYAPIPLFAKAGQPWQAGSGSLMRTGQTLKVTVANRGAHVAKHVGLRIWWGQLDSNGKTLLWNAASTAASPLSLAAGGKVVFSVDIPKRKAQAPLWVFVSADAPADPSNMAESKTPPTSWDELMELVAHDNNLALGRP